MKIEHVPLVLVAALLSSAPHLLAGRIGPFPGIGTAISVPSLGDTSRSVSIPYAESFEGCSVGMPVVALTNWVAPSEDWSVIAQENYTYGGELPLMTNHTRVVQLDTEGQALLCSVTGTASHVWADMMARFTPSEEDPWLADGFGLALFVNAESSLAVYGRSAGATNYAAFSSSLVIDPLQWYRVRLHLAYPACTEDAFFSVTVDQTPVAWLGGEALPGVPSASGSGPWLRFAFNPASKVFPGLAFSGYCAVDDLVIDNRYRGVAHSATTGLEQAVAVTWPSDYGRLYRVDFCSALASNAWQTLKDEVVGNGTTNTVFDLSQNRSACFYRVVPLDP